MFRGWPGRARVSSGAKSEAVYISRGSVRKPRSANSGQKAGSDWAGGQDFGVCLEMLAGRSPAEAQRGDELGARFWPRTSITSPISNGFRTQAVTRCTTSSGTPLATPLIKITGMPGQLSCS